MDYPYVVVFEAGRTAACSERALLLNSQGIQTEIVHEAGRCLLLVPERDAELALRELAAYQEELAQPAPRRHVIRYDYQAAWPGIFGYALTIMALTTIVALNPGDVNWYFAGKLDVARIAAGEWWRTVTALTLHIDLAHVAGNLVFGVVFGYFAGQYLGSGVAWLAILLSGVAGNAVNSLVQDPSHTAVGASTAIFGALGIISAFAWRRRLYPQDRWAYRLGPVVGGIALLAYTGAGGERTDIGAHLFGFACGFGIGYAFAEIPRLVTRDVRLQWAAGAAALALLAIAWRAALAAG